TPASGRQSPAPRRRGLLCEEGLRVGRRGFDQLDCLLENRISTRAIPTARLDDDVGLDPDTLDASDSGQCSSAADGEKEEILVVEEAKRRCAQKVTRGLRADQYPETVSLDDPGQHLLTASNAVVDQEILGHRAPECALAERGQVILARTSVAASIIHHERIDPIVLEALERGLHAFEDGVSRSPQVEIADALAAYGDDSLRSSRRIDEPAHYALPPRFEGNGSDDAAVGRQAESGHTGTESEGRKLFPGDREQLIADAHAYLRGGRAFENVFHEPPSALPFGPNPREIGFIGAVFRKQGVETPVMHVLTGIERGMTSAQLL